MTDDATLGFARPSHDPSRLSALANRSTAVRLLHSDSPRIKQGARSLSCANRFRPTPNPTIPRRTDPTFRDRPFQDAPSRAVIPESLSTPEIPSLRPETADLARRASATRSIPTITAAELSKIAGSDSAPSPDLGFVSVSIGRTATRGQTKISRRRS